tara:strand:+ start:285 stop:578 length:294 start_codon:yes stop_codon:yes gene_type:complete
MSKKSKYGSKMKGGRTVKNTKYSSKMSKMMDGRSVPTFNEVIKMKTGGKVQGMRAGGMMGVPRTPSMPTGPSKIRKVQRSVRPDPKLPRGKKGKGDI